MKHPVPEREWSQRRRGGGEERSGTLQVDSHVSEEDSSGSGVRSASDAEAARRESEDWRLTLMAASPLGIVVTDPDSNVLLWNKAAQRLFGWSDTQVLGRQAPFIPAELEGEEAACREAVMRGEIHAAETQRLRRDGSLVDVRLTASPMMGQGGRVARILAFFEDITERKRVSRMLSEEARLMELIASGGEIQQCVAAVTEAVARLLPGVQAAALTADELRHSINLVPGASLSASLREGIQGLPIKDEPIGARSTAICGVEPVTCPDIAHEQRWPELWRRTMLAHGIRAIHSTPIFSAAGTAIASFLLCFAQVHEPDEYERAIGRLGAHIVGIALERDYAARSVEESEERFRTLSMASSDVIYEMSPDWSSMRRIYGRGFLSSAGDPAVGWLNEYIHPDDQEFVKARIQAAIQKKQMFELEHRIQLGDGSAGWALTRAVPLLDAKGEIKGWFGAASDITSRKRAEEALMKTEKLAAAGRMAATVAHEINNPLESIINLLYLARQDREMSDESRKFLNTASEELDRASHVVKQTLGFYRDSAAASWFSVGGVAADLIRMYRQKRQGREIRLETRTNSGQGEARIFAPEGEFRQVISNLLSNAVDATNSGSGRIRVRVGPAKLSQIPQGSDGVRITIADNGCGIDPERKARIFEAFFTTKQDVGTGLGLWVAHGILQKHHATVRVRSRTTPGESGTVFTVLWPNARPTAPALVHGLGA